MKNKGLLIVISAPSGAGKSTLCDTIIARNRNFRRSISCTTRPPRPGEKNGRDYYFLSKQKFQSLIRSGGLVEWAVVHGNYYGTPKAPLKKNIALGRDVILNIDVQGGFSVKKHFNNSVLIFVMAPSFKDLEKRLKGRGQDSEEVIRRRLLNAKNEIACLKKYEYLVINDKLNRAALEIEAIILAEHRRVRNISNTSFKK